MKLGSDMDPRVSTWLGVLWGKSKEKAAGTTNLLICHLLDTAAVGELIWDHFLAPATRSLLDEVAGETGKGRALFAWLCGIHDCGKATPAHQRIWAEGARAVQAAGLTWADGRIGQTRWRHDVAGGQILRKYLGAGENPKWEPSQVDWVWPLVAGHHGRIPRQGKLAPPARAARELCGRGPEWPLAQHSLIEVFTRELGFADVAAVQPAKMPSRATQLHLSGLIVMADWIASNEKHFEGIDDLDAVGIERSRKRAANAWQNLGLRGGWGAIAEPGEDFFRQRFGRSPRPFQQSVIEAARRMDRPGILTIEAAMGEGKTKAALAAAEILAARFGADGVFLGMPTQATSDPMFTELRTWLAEIDSELPAQVGLLHGRRRFTSAWRELLKDGESNADAEFAGVDEFNMDDCYGTVAATDEATPHERHVPAEWLLGSKRGLLCPFVVGTIDQLLMAATRTKHVMLRMAGLLGKVVILDEVHAADVYMSRFLAEGLHWLGQAGVPVVLLSATLPPAQRRTLLAAYLAGAASQSGFTLSAAGESTSYPQVMAAWLGEDGTTQRGCTAESRSWRSDQHVAVSVLPERFPVKGDDQQERDRLAWEADSNVAMLLRDQLADGGCALVIRNTVARAQSLYSLLRATPGWGADDVVLLHARLTTQSRADRTDRCLKLLGSPDADGALPRPRRFVLIATQLAEQSFDIDADLLVTDLAPIDLLLQRIGRVHRHDGVHRPEAVRAPNVVVTGLAPREAEAPELLYASAAIYGSPLLLRTAAEVLRITGMPSDAATASIPAGWTIPADIPALVTQVYETDRQICPAGWAEELAAAQRDWDAEQAKRAANADVFLLTEKGEQTAPTLAGLHDAAAGKGDDQMLSAVVRDGEESTEAILVTHDGSRYRTLSGRALTANGDVAADLLDDVLGATVRLPAKFTAHALDVLLPLPGWRGDPWLRGSRALVLDRQGVAVQDEQAFRLPSTRPAGPEIGLRYDRDLGLIETRHPPRN